MSVLKVLIYFIFVFFFFTSQVFQEPKNSQDVEKTLADYAAAIRGTTPTSTKKGAILFCVVSGKMSEGINFSDELGR